MTSSSNISLVILVWLLCVKAHAQIIYKCVNQGKTVYSESPCHADDYQNNRFEVRDDRIGNTTYDRQTIDGARSRIRVGIDERGIGVGTRTNLPIGANAARASTEEVRQQKCVSIKNKKKELEVRSRRRHSDYAFDQLRAKQVQLKSDAYDWGC